MGITEELLQKKSKKTTGITQQLLERKKAGMPAAASHIEVTDNLLGGALVRNNPAMQVQVQKMGQAVSDALLKNARETMPSPIEATDNLLGGALVENNPVVQSQVQKMVQELDEWKNFGYLQQAQKNGTERLGQIEKEIQAAEQTRWDNPLPAGVASGLKFAQTMREDPQTGMEQVQKNLQAQEEIRALEREKERINYIRANAGKTFDDNFFGQFGASYALGRMRQDESLAWNKYLEDPTEENRAYAEAIGQLANKFEQENAATLAPDATLPWVSQSLANYLPQFADQVKYSAVGAIGGAAVGSAVPVLGTATGIKAGITAASGLYSYQTMRGAAFKSLLDLGADEETAKAAANDEAVVSSLIEMADTGIDLLTLGRGKLISALTKGGVKTLAKEGAEKAAESAGKKLLKALGKYGLNVAGEFSEEAAQQAVSIANADRVRKGADDGILGLMADAGYGVLWEAAENQDDPNRAEILEAGAQGAIVAGLMGPLQAGFNQLAYTGVTVMDTRASADYGQQLRQQGLENTVIEAGLKFQEGSQVWRMADAISQKQQSGQQITEVELGDLYRSIKLGQQQAYQTTMQQAQEEARQQESAEIQQTEGILLPTADEVEVQARAAEETNQTRRSGILAEAKEADMESAARLSQALGRNVQFFREEAGPAGTVNGYYDANTGTIYINSRSQNPVAQIIAHELTHSVEMAESYGELKAVVMEQLEQEGVDITQRRQELRQRYERNNKPLQDDVEADQEIVAQFVEQKLLTDEQTIMELTRTNRTLMERILGWINRTLQKLGVKKTSERDTLERAREIYARALQESGREQKSDQAKGAGADADLQEARGYLRRALEQGEITEEEYDAAMETVLEEESLLGVSSLEGKEYSISESYEEEIDQWDANGRPDGEVFVLGSTGDVLQGLGAMEQDIYLRSEKVNAILVKHPEMSLEEIKRIPEVLDDPVLIIKSTGQSRGGQNTRLVITGTLRAQNGKPVLATLDLRPVENTLVIDDMQKVNTAFGRSNAGNYIQNSEVLYADEKRTIPLLKTMGLQSRPIELQRYGSMGSISYKGQNVNISGIPFREIVSTKQPWDNQKKRYSISDDHESVQSGITMPTAEESMGQVMPQEDAAALAQEESMSSEEMAKALQQESDAYFEGLLEEAEQDDAPKETVTKKDLKEFWDMVEGTEEYRKLTINAEDKVRTDAKKKSKTTGQAIKEAYRAFIRSMVDSGEAVQRAGKIANDARLYEYYNAARAASSAAENMIQNERTDILGRKTGESLAETLKNVRSRGQEYYRKFQLYLYHTHNVDRMSLENLANVQQAQEAFAEVRNSMPELGKFADYQIEQMAKDPSSRYYADARDYIAARDAMRRAEGQRNKPVFGPEVTADVSRQEAAELLREYPEFEEEAQKVYDYLDNLMQYRIDSGLVTEQEAQMLKQIYPHYVPVYREFERSNTDTRGKNRVQIGKTIRRAKGGEEIIMPLHKSMALQTRSVVREGTKNRFGSRLLEDQLSRSERGRELVKNVQETVAEVNANTFDQLEDTAPKRNNVFTVLQDGKRYDMEVDPSLFTAVEALGNNGEAGNNILTATVRKFNNLFKAMVTGYNPAFMARNFIRDLQDAALYSKDAKAWAANYPVAIKEIASNGEYWRQYKALGGVHSSVFDYETGMTRESKNPASKILNRVEALNMAVEQAPRLAEFIATVKKAENAEAGVTMDTLMEALYNANDITTNFGRSGTIGKWLNANLVPFLNPSIQGFDKMLRKLGETKDFKSWANLAAKAALLGIAPALINQFVYGDEDDWDKIKQRDRDVYYLFKIGDGKWLKIPKGRALSLVGMAANRTIEAARGEQIDILDTLNTAISQTAPSNPLENNILQAWMDADLLDKDSPGKTWYGSDIESQRLQNYAPGERYDQSTDKLSKFLGQATGLSPAKINYLLDQYTGVVGDILLPMITPSDTSIPGLAPVVSAFTLDTAYSNRTSGDFYETLDQLTYAKNKEDANGYETVVYRFFNKQAVAVGEINAAIREIEADEALSDAEKRELSRAQYQIRNSVEEQALDKVAAYQAAAEKYYEASDKEDEEDKIEEAYREANREIMGAEYALKTYSKEVYERAAALQEDGVSYETFFDLYFDNRDTELTGYEKTNRTRDLLRELDVDEEQKKALYKDFVSDSETNQERIKSLEDAGATFDDFLTIQNKYNELNETVDKAKQKSVAFAYWLDTEGFTEEQSAAAQGAFKFYSQIPGQDTTYEKFKNSGLSAEEAYRLAVGLDILEPGKGNETVSKEQKWREVLDSDLSSEKKLAALKSVSTETQAEKFEIADAYGVDLEEYVSIMERLPEFDADGNGRYTQSEVTNAINSIMGGGTEGLVLPNLSGGLVLPVAGGGANRDKAVLWQLITGSKSAKNNPYSVEVGEEVLQSLGQNSGGLVLPDLGGSGGGLVLPDLGDSSGGLVLPDLGDSSGGLVLPDLG